MRFLGMFGFGFGAFQPLLTVSGLAFLNDRFVWGWKISGIIGTGNCHWPLVCQLSNSCCRSCASWRPVGLWCLSLGEEMESWCVKERPGSVNYIQLVTWFNTLVKFYNCWKSLFLKSQCESLSFFVLVQSLKTLDPDVHLTFVLESSAHGFWNWYWV